MGAAGKRLAIVNIPSQSMAIHATRHHGSLPVAVWRRQAFSLPFPPFLLHSSGWNSQPLGFGTQHENGCDRQTQWQGRHRLQLHSCTLLFPAVMISSIGPDANRCRTSLSVSSNGAGTRGPLKNFWIAHRCCLTERDSPKYDITGTDARQTKPGKRCYPLLWSLLLRAKSCIFFSASCEG